MNLMDLSSICISSMAEMLNHGVDYRDCDVIFCDGENCYHGVNIQLRANKNHDSYILIFTVKY